MTILRDLNDYQKHMIGVYAQKWNDLALSTEPCDRAKAEEGVKLAYQIAQLPDPEMHWVESPPALLKRIVKDFEYFQRLTQNAKGLARYLVFDTQLKYMDRKIHAFMLDMMMVDFRAVTPSSKTSRLYDTIRRSIRNEINLLLSDYPSEAIMDMFYDHLVSGTFSPISRLGMAEYARDALGLSEATRSAHGLIQAAQNTHLWWSFDGVAFLCERPALLKFDQRDQLHNPDGPALSYRDGANLFIWHGMPVPETIILHPEKIKVEQIFAEPNMELRRVMIERIGYERLFQEAEGIEVDRDVENSGNFRYLLRLFMHQDESIVCLKVICPSTGRAYMLRVPPSMRTCRQAAAWIAGFDNPSAYNPILET